MLNMFSDTYTQRLGEICCARIQKLKHACVIAQMASTRALRLLYIWKSYSSFCGSFMKSLFVDILLGYWWGCLCQTLIRGVKFSKLQEVGFESMIIYTLYWDACIYILSLYWDAIKIKGRYIFFFYRKTVESKIQITYNPWHVSWKDKK